VYYGVGGTSSPSTDRNGLSGTVTIGAGSSNGTVTITPVDDALVEGNETVVLTLTTNAAYAVGSPASATVTIVDNDAAVKPTVTIAATDNTATEAGRTTGTFTISRSGSTSASLTVYYGVGGTSSPSTDRNGLSGNLVIPAGYSSARIVITPVDDATVEGDETVVLTLTANAAYAVGSPASATVRIISND
jgi:hypothetical protein